MCPAHTQRLTYRLPAPGVEPVENTHLPTHAAETGARIALEHFKPLPFKIGRARLFPEKCTGAHDHAERIRERLPRRLQELRERCGLSKYGLARESGLSRNACGSAMLAKKAL